MGSKLVKRKQSENVSQRMKQKVKRAKLNSKKVSNGVERPSTGCVNSSIAIHVFDHVLCVCVCFFFLC